MKLPILQEILLSSNLNKIQVLNHKDIDEAIYS